MQLLKGLCVCVCVSTCVCALSCVWPFATPWTVAHQVPLSLRFSRQEYQSGLPWPPPRWSFTPRNQILIFTSPALAGGFFNTSTTLEVPVNNQFRSVTQSCPTLCDPHGLQHTRPPCPSPTPGAYSNSCPLSRWCHLTISSSVIPFTSCLQSFPSSGSFPMSQFFTSGDQSIWVSASASGLPMNIQDWFSLGLTGWISL